MKKLLLLFAFPLLILPAHAQLLSPSIGVGFVGLVEGENYPVAVLGVEGSGANHWSLSTLFLLGGKQNVSYNSLLSNKRYWGMELDARFYFKKEVQRGFFLSSGFYYGREIISIVEPTSQRFGSSVQQVGWSFGMGFSQKINEKISLQLNSSLGVDFIHSGDARLRAGMGITYNLL